ncbi:hypothetical protein Ga0074812_12815 [Parafrankia irregularis]|uniref:Septum formation initiator n=1 Tax=Parafrankia irregularis TaxID=795642 RepID=A0A0S4QUY9_9ACTN|nr:MULTISPECIES: hypothetical protein [Parafrankia]MBE3201966.1 hypothetical protein [Parafrankia sp. CH37]CUU59445.1 hypothetical protein Ga0074812_12815 [Parafrankia irregularis]
MTAPAHPLPRGGRARPARRASGSAGHGTDPAGPEFRRADYVYDSTAYDRADYDEGAYDSSAYADAAYGRAGQATVTHDQSVESVESVESGEANGQVTGSYDEATGQRGRGGVIPQRDGSASGPVRRDRSTGSGRARSRGQNHEGAGVDIAGYADMEDQTMDGTGTRPAATRAARAGTAAPRARGGARSGAAGSGTVRSGAGRSSVARGAGAARTTTSRSAAAASRSATAANRSGAGTARAAATTAATRSGTASSRSGSAAASSGAAASRSGATARAGAARSGSGRLAASMVGGAASAPALGSPLLRPDWPRLSSWRLPGRSNAPRGPFVALLLVLMGAGLLSLLLLNIALMEHAFHADELEQKAATLARQEQELSVQLDEQSDPGQLAARATQLGMVAGEVPVFLPRDAPLPPGARVLTREAGSGMLLVVVPSAAANGTAATGSAATATTATGTGAGQDATGTAGTTASAGAGTPSGTGGAVGTDTAAQGQGQAQAQGSASAAGQATSGGGTAAGGEPAAGARAGGEAVAGQ